jgi:lipid-binding SYLF domain-containing protein
MRPGFIATVFTLTGLSLATMATAITGVETKRIGDAARVLTEIRSASENQIPQDIWQRARCVVAIPGFKKGAVILGAEYGKGLVSCRMSNGWSAPAYVALEEGSLGAQIGVESVDLVMLVMNQRGVDHLLRERVTLGAEAAVAAGPLARDANKATDAQLKAEILSYSRAKGLFAGVDLTGECFDPTHGQTTISTAARSRRARFCSTVACGLRRLPNLSSPRCATSRVRPPQRAARRRRRRRRQSDCEILYDVRGNDGRSLASPEASQPSCAVFRAS